MFNIADLAEAEYIIELGGVDHCPQPSAGLHQECARCKSRRFVIPLMFEKKRYRLCDDNTVELWECWEVCCADCGMKQEILIITRIPPNEPYPRRELLKAAMFDEGG